MRVQVGVVGRAHGVRGEVSVTSTSDRPAERLRPGAVFSTAEDGGRRLVVEAARPHQERWLVTFDTVLDRDDAISLQGQPLWFDIDPAAERPEGGDTDYYDTELIGLRVLLSDGREWGHVVDVLHMPAQDLLVANQRPRRQAATARRRERPDDVLIPFVASIVTRVDLTAGVVHVDPPLGLGFDPVEEEPEVVEAPDAD